MRTPDDLVLIRLARAGSSEACVRLFEKYWPLARDAAFALTFDRGLAEDVAQEALERVLRSLDRFDEERPLGPWVRRIAVNRAIDELRRDRRLARAEAAAPVPERAPWGDHAGDGDRAVIAAVAGLPVEKRLVVVLHYWLDYSAAQIAELFDLPRGTVTARLSRARNELRKLLEESGEKEEDAA